MLLNALLEPTLERLPVTDETLAGMCSSAMDQAAEIYFSSRIRSNAELNEALQDDLESRMASVAVAAMQKNSVQSEKKCNELLEALYKNIQAMSERGEDNAYLRRGGADVLSDDVEVLLQAYTMCPEEDLGPKKDEALEKFRKAKVILYTAKLSRPDKE